MQLEVGTILVRGYSYSESLCRVDRVTPKMAFVGTTKLKREVEGTFYEIGSSGWSRIRYNVATEEDIARIQEKQKKSALRHFIEAACKLDHPLEALQSAADALGYKNQS